MKRGLAVILSSLLVISIFVIIAGFPKAHAGTFPGVNGKIAFQRHLSSGIYVINPDGTGEESLTTKGDYTPDWSSDGKKIAFSSLRDGKYEIYIMNADGTNQTRLTNNSFSDNSPSWSPDGKKIAFTSHRVSDSFDIYVMNSDGTNQTRLTVNSINDYGPSWSPDGSTIAFTSDRDGLAAVYLMNADGTEQRALTDIDYSLPNWSPDAKKIAFVSGAENDIFVINADGTGLTRLTDTPGRDTNPIWSPDGTKIAFATDRDLVQEPDGGLCFCNLQIYIMNADGTIQTRITNSPTEDREPSWEPLLPISGENALIADDGVISLGETTKLIQKIDASSGITGTLLSLHVLEADGDTCVANGLPETIPASGILTKEYPTDFSLDTARGDGACNTTQIGVYEAESEVEVDGVVSKSTAEFQTNFFVIPESPLGAAALIGSSLAALGGFMYFRRH